MAGVLAGAVGAICARAYAVHNMRMGVAPIFLDLPVYQRTFPKGRQSEAVAAANLSLLTGLWCDDVYVGLVLIA